MKIRENVPISELTTMRLGGAARFVIEIADESDVKEAYDFAKARGLPVWAMGGGANMIGRDEGFGGVVILNRIKGIFVRENGELIAAEDLNEEDFDDEMEFQAMGGEIWDDFVEFAAKHGYTGVEAMSKIPGTVGAAPVQNIGAYGQDLAQVVTDVRAFDTRTGEFLWIPKAEMGLEYRATRFNSGADAGRFFIVAARIKLRKGNLQPPFYNSLQQYIDEKNVTDFSPINIRKIVSEIREEKLPNPATTPSAGSFFKNVLAAPGKVADAKAQGIPVWENADGSGKINAGWLIEACGLKGKLLHGFRVSDQAALVLINESAEKYADLAQARQEIVEAVREKFGFTLEQEPVEMIAS